MATIVTCQQQMTVMRHGPDEKRGLEAKDAKKHRCDTHCDTPRFVCKDCYKAISHCRTQMPCDGEASHTDAAHADHVKRLKHDAKSGQIAWIAVEKEAKWHLSGNFSDSNGEGGGGNANC